MTKEEEERIERKINEVLNKRKINEGKYRETENRLRAYPILKRNIEEYKLDIEDIKCEDMRRSKDIVIYTTTAGGLKAGLEEIRAAKIIRIEQDIARDEIEIRKIERALNEIKKDKYYKIIEMIYFKNSTREEVAAIYQCETKTIARNKNRLINIISVKLYGADALPKCPFNDLLTTFSMSF